MEGRQGRGAAALVDLGSRRLMRSALGKRSHGGKAPPDTPSLLRTRGNMARRIPVGPVRSWSTTANLWDAAGAGRSLRVRLFSFEHFRTRADVILCFSPETFEPTGAGLVFLRHHPQPLRGMRVRNLARDASTEGGMIQQGSSFPVHPGKRFKC